ncbi:hypothetical protein [Endozoicomonas sp. 8E]|uniref:hypothetical protein n=1 Tax=Endozoicomonas sp. 8E TaxID=3035692 RepID=UPI00293927A9|nr:hypothetical protein [Endozoicomonas sp. 8E]WOG29623.1 hypothetical protein P6910_08205 [Endozoicomonas sp. 8E]
MSLSGKQHKNLWTCQLLSGLQTALAIAYKAKWPCELSRKEALLLSCIQTLLLCAFRKIQAFDGHERLEVAPLPNMAITFHGS